LSIGLLVQSALFQAPIQFRFRFIQHRNHLPVNFYFHTKLDIIVFAFEGGCTAPLVGPVAWLVNGVALYGWGDTTSYQNGDVWQNVAMSFEIYDMDPCYGHAANEQYHRKKHFID